MKKYKFTIKGHEYDVEIKKFEENIAKIEVNGTLYSVEVHKEIKSTKTPTLVRTNTPPPKSAPTLQSSSTISTISAPLPGSIIEVLVKVGDNVKKEQKLIILEAMKMENSVLSEKDGIIKSIKVKTGDSVLQGDLLIEIE